MHAPDGRGSLLKVATSADGGMLPGAAEVFVNTSGRGVVRGLHLAGPPASHDKLICCISGAVFDVLVDLRIGSPAYGQARTVVLRADTPLTLHVPAGVAHGFQALADDSRLLYVTTSAYDPACELGVRFDSVGVDWPEPVGAVSARDRGLPPLAAFVSPFAFRPIEATCASP